MKKDSEKDEVDKIKEMIEKSGNNFHYKVVNYFRVKEWNVLVSPYYSDNFSEKPREIDLVVEKQFPINKFMEGIYGFLNVRFFIECKYIKENVVFWFDKRDEGASRDLVLSSTPLSQNNTYTDRHHYLKNDMVAKLNFGMNGSEDVIYKAMTQVLNSQIYFRGRDVFSTGCDEFREVTVEYPIILCNNFSKFYKVEESKNEGYCNIDDNFQLEINYAFFDKEKNNRGEYFLVDIINFEKIDSFLEQMENKEDIFAIKEILQCKWRNDA